MIIALGIPESTTVGSALMIIFGVSFFSLALTAIPAIAYSMLMEYVFNPKINNSLIVVALSTLAGFLTGAQMYENGWHKFGAIVGLAAGIVLRVHFCHSQKTAQKANNALN